MVRKWSIDSAWRDDVELAALVELERDVARRLEAGAEAALGLAHALGDRPHLAVALGHRARRCGRPRRACRCAARCRVAVEADHPLSPRPPPKRRSRPLVLADRFEEVLAPEVGPQHVGEHELAVGQLPQQEVRDAVLARRADHEVGVGHRRGRRGAGGSPSRRSCRRGTPSSTSARTASTISARPP